MTAEKPVPIDWGKWDVEINGTPLAVDTASELSVEDDEVAEALARWHHTLAEAEYEACMVEAHYRAWAAEVGCQLLAKDGKLAEWKVRQSMHDHPSYRHYKEAIAMSRRNVTMVQGIVEGLRARTEMG